MSAPPFMKLYIAEYLAETTHLEAVGHGAYLLLIMAMWRAGGKLPRDEAKLARIARCTPEQWAAIRDDVMAYFKVSGGTIRHNRVSKEIAKYDAVVDGAKSAGKASASKRANKNKAEEVNDRSENVERKSNQIEPEPEEEREDTPIAPKGADLFGLEIEAAPVDDVREAFNLWNAMAPGLGLPLAKDLTEGRRRAIRKRLDVAGLPGWREALAAVSRSKLCRGDNDRAWKADLDFVCQAKSFTKLREGSYGADAVPPAGAANAPTYSFDGPPILRASVVSATDESFASKFIDPAHWDAENRTLVAHNPYAADMIRRDLKIWLVEKRVSVSVLGAAAAAKEGRAA